MIAIHIAQYLLDWQGWADAVAMDYNQTEFDGDRLLLEGVMTDKELEQKSDDLMRLFFSFCDDAELDKYIIVEHDESSNECHERFTESNLLAAIKNG